MDRSCEEGVLVRTGTPRLMWPPVPTGTHAMMAEHTHCVRIAVLVGWPWPQVCGGYTRLRRHVVAGEVWQQEP